LFLILFQYRNSCHQQEIEAKAFMESGPSESEEVKENCKPMESESITDVVLVKRTIDDKDSRTAKRLKV
jgi:hypothetical protein